MILKRIKINAGAIMGENCYIIQDENTKETMIIDPGNTPDTLIEMLDAMQVKLKYIFLTHCHGDHIGGVKAIKEKYGGKILINRNDAEGLKNTDINLSTHIGLDPVIIQEDARVDDEDILHIGNLEFKVIYTPGHTVGSMCLYCEEEKMLFSGDTLFRGSWGRIDLPTSSFEDIISSITNKLIILPPDTIVYPGHGKTTIIEEEKPIYLEMKKKDFE